MRDRWLEFQLEKQIAATSRDIQQLKCGERKMSSQERQQLIQDKFIAQDQSGFPKCKS